MFYIPDFCYRDIYIETKGYQFWDEWTNKRAIIHRKYPQMKIIVVQHHDEFIDVINFLRSYK
jgi:hypothetical protein